MKPFNREEALSGKPCINAKGNKVVIFADAGNLIESTYPLFGVVYAQVGMNYVERYSATGDVPGFESKLVGMWEDPQPKVNIMGLPSPLLKVEDGESVWCWIDYNGSYRTLEFTFEQSSTSDKCKLESGLIFATEEDAQAWLDAMKGARR